MKRWIVATKAGVQEVYSHSFKITEVGVLLFITDGLNPYMAYAPGQWYSVVEKNG